MDKCRSFIILILLLLLLVPTSAFAKKKKKEKDCGPVVAHKSLEDIFEIIAGYVTYDQNICRAMEFCTQLTSTSIKSDCKIADRHFRASRSIQEGNESGHCGLNPSEQAVLTFYTSNGYTCMNKYLRDSTLKNEDVKKASELLNHALKKIPAYHGFVMRGATLPENIRLLHTKGKIVEYPAFTSTSTAGTRAFAGTDMFIIYSRTGKPIMGFSTVSEENEVLFAAGTKFKILDTFVKGEINYYVMKEVFPMKKGLEKMMDEEFLKTYRANSKKDDQQFDRWVCPAYYSKPMEKVIKQKYFPPKMVEE